MEKFKEYIQGIQDRFNQLTPVQKLALIGIPTALLIVGFATFLLLTKENYTILYTGLSPQDLNAIVSELDKEGVEYRISPDGRTVYVPESIVREIRLKLASKGIPNKGIVGYEIFDKTGIGISRFQQQVNFKRAIEGELARTIMSLECVDYARVHIVLPEKSIFIREEGEAKASVFLKLFPGCELTPEQVKAIRNLVAGSVEDLKPSQVVVIDDKGRDLTAYLEEENVLLERQLKIKRDFEKSLEKKILKALEGIVGFGRVRVSVSAELDFSKTKKKEELYDPDLTAVVSEQRRKEKITQTVPRGIPGTQANVPPATGAHEGGQVLTERKESITNYEVSKRELYYEDETIKVKRISVGVIIDKDVEVDAEKLKDLIVASAGLNPKRGDRISILKAPIITKPPTVIEKEAVPAYLPLIILAFSLLLLLIIAFGIFRFLRKKPATPPPTAVPPVEVVKKKPYEELIEIARKEPEKVAVVLKRWLREA